MARQASCVDVYADANWAGLRRTRKSTSGGCTMVGYHCIKTWSKTQALVAKSSAESELYGTVKASCEALGTLTLMGALGQEMCSRVHVDATAAKSIAERSGLDKVRHIYVNVLWIQEQEDPTKNLEAVKIEENLSRMSIEFRTGRSEKASNLYAMGQGGSLDGR